MPIQYCDGVHPVHTWFEERLNKYCEFTGLDFKINSGFRSYEEQVELKRGHENDDSIASPNGTPHRTGCAIDSGNSAGYPNISDRVNELGFDTVNAEMKQFNIYLPLSGKYFSSPIETWHVEAIETLPYTEGTGGKERGPMLVNELIGLYGTPDASTSVIPDGSTQPTTGTSPGISNQSYLSKYGTLDVDGKPISPRDELIIKDDFEKLRKIDPNIPKQFKTIWPKGFVMNWSKTLLESQSPDVKEYIYERLNAYDSNPYDLFEDTRQVNTVASRFSINGTGTNLTPGATSSNSATSSAYRINPRDLIIKKAEELLARQTAGTLAYEDASSEDTRAGKEKEIDGKKILYLNNGYFVYQCYDSGDISIPSSMSEIKSLINNQDKFKIHATDEQLAGDILLIGDRVLLLKDKTSAYEMTNPEGLVIVTEFGEDYKIGCPKVLSDSDAAVGTDNGVNTLIIGKPVKGEDKLLAFIASLPGSFTDQDRAKTAARIYIEYGNKWGIRGDIAFAQACEECAYFTSDLAQDPYNNFAGLGKTSSGAISSDTYDYSCSRNSIQGGVKYHLRHLWHYTKTEPVPWDINDPDCQDARESDINIKTVHELDGTWCQGVPGYDTRVMDIYNQI